jgi:SAM-dependent methyltransferase
MRDEEPGRVAGEVGGYVADIPYLRDFKPMLAPAWLDHVALVGGIEPPARQDGFAWCDLGCGQGITALILAATHPGGVFHGIDAMPAHVGHACRLAAEAGVANARFHAVDFAAAAHLELPRFDYLVTHGVYTWIDATGRRALRRFIDHRLAPGGLVYISYNAMPGWARDLPFQRLLRELAGTATGDSARRVAAAADTVRALARQAPALAASSIVRELSERPQDYPAPYLVHEFLHRAWQPLYVTELRADMATIGLVPVGSATLIENFDDLVLGKAARERLASIPDGNLRELVRDYFLDQRFRCDVFARGNRRLDAAERDQRILAGGLALTRPPATIRFATTTPRGRVGYDSPAARAIVAALASGPRVPADLVADLLYRPNLLDGVLTLCAGGDAMPVEMFGASVGALNRALWQRLDGPDEVLWLALPCGSALPVERELLRRLRDGAAIDDARFSGWPEFLAGHGL